MTAEKKMPSGGTVTPPPDPIRTYGWHIDHLDAAEYRKAQYDRQKADAANPVKAER